MSLMPKEVPRLVRFSGEQGWCSGEGARLPPVCPGFGSRTRRHMWVDFCCWFSTLLRKVSPRYSGFPLLLKNPTFPNSSSIVECTDISETSSCELLGAPWVNKLHFYDSRTRVRLVLHLRAKETGRAIVAFDGYNEISAKL